ncbi:BzdV protein, partial [Bacteroidota bacterium]
LGCDGIISGDEKQDVKFDSKIGKIEEFCRFERVPVALNEAEKRKTNFEQVELGYTETEAIRETTRCLQCGLRMNIGQNPYPPEKYLEFNLDNVEKVNGEEGVIQLLNTEKEVFLIKGSENMRDTLIGFIEEGKEASYFTYESDPLFSKRESELMQQYLQKHGEMPDSGDDLDDLF